MAKQAQIYRIDYRDNNGAGELFVEGIERFIDWQERIESLGQVITWAGLAKDGPHD